MSREVGGQGEIGWGCVPVSPSAVLVHRTEGLVDSFSQGLEGLCTVSSSVLHGIEPRLKDFHQLLLSPPKVGELLVGACAGVVGGMICKQRTLYPA